MTTHPETLENIIEETTRDTKPSPLQWIPLYGPLKILHDARADKPTLLDHPPPSANADEHLTNLIRTSLIFTYHALTYILPVYASIVYATSRTL